jgi:chromate transporter
MLMTGSPLEVLLVFLRLGCTSFGGPVAHIGFFRAEFVERRRWVPESDFADLVALCQFMPGPASSQLGISIGLLRAGPLGMICAWVGFTLPSALAMLAFAYGVEAFGDVSNAAWLKGLKLVAVAVVAQAVSGMAQSLAPDRPRATLAVAAALIALAVPSSVGQIAAIVLGAIVGLTLLPRPTGAGAIDHTPLGLSLPRGIAVTAIILFFALLLLLPRSQPRSIAKHCGCSRRSIAPVRWCSAAATWCCRCCRLP